MPKQADSKDTPAYLPVKTLQAFPPCSKENQKSIANTDQEVCEHILVQPLPRIQPTTLSGTTWIGGLAKWEDPYLRRIEKHVTDKAEA